MRHAKADDFAGSPLRLIAVPEAGDTSTYARLNRLRAEANALVKSIDRYLHTPAFPANAEYREARMKMVEENIADMRKALSDG